MKLSGGWGRGKRKLSGPLKGSVYEGVAKREEWPPSFRDDSKGVHPEIQFL